MAIVKILGALDLFGAFVVLMLIFGIHPFLQIMLFCSGLLFFKGMFILTGDIFSIQDLYVSVIIFLSIFFSLPSVLLWIAAFFLIAKGTASMF